MKLIALLLTTSLFAAAQTQPVFRVSVTSRTAKAVSYRNRSGATKIDFAGTSLMPKAHGEAKVESKQGYIEVEVEFRNLPAASSLGAEYLTYVLWAITPEGRTSNLGELLRNGTSAKLDVTTELQAFGLIVTAEPYFAVSTPSDMVVMENVVRPDTLGKLELIDAKYELLQPGQYKPLVNFLGLKPNPKTPLEVYEARNAVRIARSIGAEMYAAETFHKAEENLKQAEAYLTRKAGTKPVTMTARQAVQVAEDSRAIAVKRQSEDMLAAERENSAAREASARNDADRAERDAAQTRSAAETARLRAEADAARAQLAANNQANAAQNEADRVRRANEAQLSASAAEAARLKSEADAKMAAANSALSAANLATTQAEAEKAALRAKLLLQFNAVLQTRDTARGLIVNMSDVLFDTAKFTLRPEAREKLAKVAGIVAAYPDLRLAVEGHTDNVGGDEYNQTLSEQRGSSVRDYLTGQGMPVNSVTTKGFGETQPTATNETSQGRQQNRRVELVISGEVIGQRIGNPAGAQ